MVAVSVAPTIALPVTVGRTVFCGPPLAATTAVSFEFAVAVYVRELLHRLPTPLVTSVLSHLPVNEEPAANVVLPSCACVNAVPVKLTVEFPEIPRTGDYVILAPGNPLVHFHVDRVVIAPVGFAPEVAEIFVSPAG